MLYRFVPALTLLMVRTVRHLPCADRRFGAKMRSTPAELGALVSLESRSVRADRLNALQA